MSFLGSQPPTSGYVSVRVPAWPGAVAAAAALVSAGLLVVASGQPVVCVVGYLLGAVAAPALAVVHRVLAERARKHPWFVYAARPGQMVMLALALGMAAGLGHAWFLATELAKQ